jgi:hypothetical protein
MEFQEMEQRILFQEHQFTMLAVGGLEMTWV